MITEHKHVSLTYHDTFLMSYLESDLSKASCTFDVKSKNGQSHVVFILNRFFSSVELFPLVYILTTGLAPVSVTT